MRLKLGRPDIARYADRFDVPAAEPGAPLCVTWMGVTTLLLDDGTSALMTDGYFSRPSLAQVALGIAPHLLIFGKIRLLKISAPSQKQ